MSKLLETMTCTNCGAAVEVDDNQTKAQCGYCQSTFRVTSEKKQTQTDKKAKTPPVQFGFEKVEKTTRQQKHGHDPRDFLKQNHKYNQQVMANTKKSAATGIIITIVILLFSGGITVFSIFMSKNQATNRARKFARQARQRKLDLERKQWNSFKNSYSSKLIAKDKKALHKLIKDLKLPILGSPKAAKTIVVTHTYNTSSSYLKKFKNFQKKVLDKYPSKFNFVIVPLPRKNFKKYREVEFLFEARLQQGDKMYFKAHDKLVRANKSEMYYLKFYKKLAKYLKIDEKEVMKALKKEVHREKINRLDKLIFELDLDRYYPNLIIDNLVYKGSLVSSRFELIARHALDIEID
jgi:type II secretory pathway pseudopilin PulG/DNA-directed RNA polymerase subunit RPC12/RpoP